MKCVILFIAVVMLAAPVQSAEIRIKDLVEFDGVRGNDLVGYGLVVGLNGTGDGLRNSPFTDFAVQLATFSGVEQQVMTNDLLRKMADGLGATGISQLAGWVGMDARVSAAAQFDGVPITLAPNPDPASDAANLIVRDGTGHVVSREAMPLGVDSILWGGVGTGGAPLPAGIYTFAQESLNRGEVTSTRPVEHYAQVREARIGEAGVEIVLVGGISVPSTGVTALRAPDSQP